MFGIPSCLQTTLASVSPHIWSHIVPQSFLTQTSTRPSVILAPSASLMLPSLQPNHKEKAGKCNGVNTGFGGLISNS